MKRIALIITRMIPGGASNVVRQIIEGAAGLREDKQYELTLFTGIEGIDETAVNEIAKYCTVIKIPSLVRNISPLKDYSAYRHLTCELRKGNFDIAHTHTSKAGFIGRIAAAKAKVPVIIHSPHGTIYTSESNIEGVPQFSFGKKVLQTAERFAGKQTTILTTLSENEKRICIKLGLSKEENTIIIPNGIDCDYFALSDEYKAKASKEFKKGKNDKILISIGRLSSEKGHSVLIDAFAKVAKSFYSEEKLKNEKDSSISGHLKLILLGDGPEKEKLKAQAINLGLNDSTSEDQTQQEDNNIPQNSPASQVIFPGYCCDIRKYLAIADAVIIPSLYEGFGIAVIEAMAANLPVIASNIGGIPEIITDNKNGILFPVGDSNALSEKIINLLGNPEKAKRIADTGLKRAKDFSETKMLLDYFKLYDS